MEKPSEAAFTREDVKALYDEFLDSLHPEEKAIVEKQTDTKGTPFEKLWLDFFEANNDGSEEAGQNILKFVQGISEQYEDAKKTGTDEDVKFFEILRKLKLPVDLEKLKQANEQRPEDQMKKDTERREPREERKSFNYREEMKNLIRGLRWEEQDQINECKWAGPDGHQEGDKPWTEGFLEYFRNDLKGIGGSSRFEKYIKKLKRNVTNAHGVDEKGLAEIQLKIAEHFQDINKKEKGQSAAENEKNESLWSKENILRTIKGLLGPLYTPIDQARKGVYKIMGWEESDEQEGMTEIAQTTASSASSHDSGLSGIMNGFFDKKRTKKH